MLGNTKKKEMTFHGGCEGLPGDGCWLGFVGQEEDSEHTQLSKAWDAWRVTQGRRKRG